jgi:nucleotide-binding universal stress UspA family protein
MEEKGVCEAMETTLPQQRSRIVVGTDGSPSSVGAVRWALEAATLVGAWLDVVLVWNPDIDFGWMGTPPVHGWVTDPATQGHAVVRSVMDRVCEEPPADTVRTFVIEGDPVRCLLAHAAGADVLVLGDRGAGGFLGLQLGSVASACVSHAPCPVLIVPMSRWIPSFSHLASTVTARPAPPRDTTAGVAR